MQAEDAATVKFLSMDILRRFYLPPYEKNADFYKPFYERMNMKYKKSENPSDFFCHIISLISILLCNIRTTWKCLSAL